MEESLSSTGTDRRTRRTTTAFAPLLLLVAAAAFSQTTVHRCVTQDGRVEFRQTACAGGAEDQEVRIDDRKTGWQPARIKIEKKTSGSVKSSARSSKTDKEKRAAHARQEEKCWNKRQLLEEVNWKLKRGYKPATGVKLRRKRRVYEDYIGRFCD